MRYKGNGTFLQSRSSLKRSLKVDLNDGFPGRKLHGVTKLNLHNNVTDASWMNEVLSYRLFRDAGVPAPRTAYARVYVTVPGKYEHEYWDSIRWWRTSTTASPRIVSARRKARFSNRSPPAMFEDMGDDWSDYQQAYDPKTPRFRRGNRRVIAFCKLVSHADDAEFAEKLGEFLDLDEFARFMAVTTWLSTFDSLLAMSQNYVVYLHPANTQVSVHSLGPRPFVRPVLPDWHAGAAREPEHPQAVGGSEPIPGTCIPGREVQTSLPGAT